MFFTDGFAGFFRAGRWAVRVAGGDPLAFVSTLRAEVARLPGPPLVTDVQPMTILVERATAGTRFLLLLIGVFAGIAAVLAAVGLYSVLSTLVRQRTAEIGVRMAFGAARGTVFRLVVGQGLRLSAIGVLVGIPAALVLTQLMRSMLVDVRPTDPLTFFGIALLFLAITAAACGIPATRAARLDPTRALREE